MIRWDCDVDIVPVFKHTKSWRLYLIYGLFSPSPCEDTYSCQEAPLPWLQITQINTLTRRTLFLAGAFPCGWHQPPPAWDRLPMGWRVVRKSCNVKSGYSPWCAAQLIQRKETPEALTQQGDAVHPLEQGYLPSESLLRNQQSLQHPIQLDKIPPLFPHLSVMWTCLRSL